MNLSIISGLARIFFLPSVNLKEYDIPIHTPNYHAHEQKVFLTELQKNYLYGAMLGDGCLMQTKRSQNSQFGYTSKSYQHVEFVSKPFNDILYLSGIKHTTYCDNRTNKTYERYGFRFDGMEKQSSVGTELRMVFRR